MKRLLATSASILAIALIGGCATVQTAPTPAETVAEMPRYSAESFFATTSFGLPSGAGHTFGPTSGDLLVLSDETGVFNAYRLDPETGEKSSLTDSTTDAVRPLSWFPEDERLLYMSDQGGDELDHIYVRELDGSVRDLTPGDAVKALFGGWADGGASFYVMTNERDGKSFDVYRYQTDGYARSLIYQNDGYQVDAVSGDGRYIALTKNRTSADSDVFIVDRFSASLEPTLITEHEGNIAHSAYGFSADNRSLYYATNEGGEFTRAVRYDLSTGDKSDAFSADWDVSYYGESPSGRYFISVINEDAASKLEIRDRDTGRLVGHTDQAVGQVRNVRFNADETRFAYLLSGDRSPSDVHVADMETGE
ncbi:MAG: S9 family peptidase, partial [Litorimonas sp.]